MTVATEIQTLSDFVLSMLIYSLPCLLGATVSYFLNYKTTKRKKKGTIVQIIGGILTSTVVPSVIITVSDTYIISKFEVDPEIFFAVAILLGAIGDDLTRLLLNMKNALVIIKALLKGTEDLKEISDAIEKASDEDKDKNENTS